MVTVTHEKGREVEVPEARVDYFVNKGWQVAVVVAKPVERVFPDPEKDNHATIDAFADDVQVTFDGIDAKDSEKPTKAEKVAHIQKVMSERESA